MLWTVISKGLHAITRNGWFTQSQRGITYRDAGRRGLSRHSRHLPAGVAVLDHLDSDRLDGRHLPGRVRPRPVGPRDHVHGRHPDRHPVDRRSAVHLRGLRHDLPRSRAGWLVSLALVMLMIPVIVRTTEEMLKLVPERTARSFLRPRGAEVEDDRADRGADSDDRHHHRRRARRRPGGRRDRAAADLGRLHPGHQRQPVQRIPGLAAGA